MRATLPRVWQASGDQVAQLVNPHLLSLYNQHIDNKEVKCQINLVCSALVESLKIYDL